MINTDAYKTSRSVRWNLSSRLLHNVLALEFSLGFSSFRKNHNAIGMKEVDIAYER